MPNARARTMRCDKACSSKVNLERSNTPVNKKYPVSTCSTGKNLNPGFSKNMCAIFIILIDKTKTVKTNVHHISPDAFTETRPLPESFL